MFDFLSLFPSFLVMTKGGKYYYYVVCFFSNKVQLAKSLLSIDQRGSFWTLSSIDLGGAFCVRESRMKQIFKIWLSSSKMGRMWRSASQVFWWRQVSTKQEWIDKKKWLKDLKQRQVSYYVKSWRNNYGLVMNDKVYSIQSF